VPDRAVEELVSSVTVALSQGVARADLLTMLEKLVKSAGPGTPEQCFAKLELAELIVQAEPFRAARLALDVLAQGAEPRAHGLLGIAYSLLGSFQASRRAYEHAVALAPDHPGYRHNLGHLLDVAFDRPALALPYLESAHREAPEQPALASSYGHALARTGQSAKAVDLLVRCLGWSREAASSVVAAWRDGKMLPADER
jgi:Flp pilus assembly protein TadD